MKYKLLSLSKTFIINILNLEIFDKYIYEIRIIFKDEMKKFYRKIK